MRLFSHSLVLSTALLVSGGILLAQDQSQPAANATPQSSPARQSHKTANPARQAKRMAKKLGLSADQQSELEPVLRIRQQQIQSVRADTTMSPNVKRTTIRGIRQNSDRKIEASLSDTQKQQYEQMKQDRQARRHAPTGSASNS
jgi:protein CpxP